MQARPKRGAAQRANYVINYIHLNFKEEQDIRKAIQASLSEAKTSRRSTNASNHSFEDEGVKDDAKGTSNSGKRHSQSLPIVAPVLASVVKKHEKRSASPAPSKDTDNNSTSIASISLPEKKKPKIPSQRKFAQNSTSLGSSTNTTPVKFGPFTPLMPTNEIFPAIKPATEDFLTFLCLRKTSLLPRKLNMFALNEEAMKNKEMVKPSAPKSSQTPIKQEAPQGTAVSGSSSGVSKSKSKSSECNNSVIPPVSSKSASRACSEKSVKSSSSSKSTCKATSSKASVKGEVKKITSPVHGKSVNRSLTSQSQSHHANNDNSNNDACKNDDEESTGSSSDSSWNDDTVREKKAPQNSSNKSKVNCDPPKRITRSTSNVNDDNVQTQLTRHKKPSNVAAKKLLHNSLKCKKKPAPSQLSKSRGFVLDRVTRSIKHLRSMEEVSYSLFAITADH